VFFVDGLASDVFERLLAEGRLPNIRAKFVDGGVRVRNAVVSMPSITYANSVSLITGMFPGHHGVLGNQWFDRETLFKRDYGFLATYEKVNTDYTARTIFEILDDRFTICVRSHTDRGAKMRIEDHIATGLDWITDNYSQVDVRVGKTVDEVARNAVARREWPAVYWNYFPGVDEIGHRHGADSQEYADAVMVVDEAIGRIVSGVELATPPDTVYWALVSDHGHAPTHSGHSLDLSDWLTRTHNRRVQSGDLQSGSRRWRAAKLDRYDTVVLNDAFRRGAIHLRGPDGWQSPADPELIREIADDLASNEAIAISCCRKGTNFVRVANERGRARIEFRGAGATREFRLLVDEGRDPLGYVDDLQLAEFVAAGWHDSASWLGATSGGEFPDFVPQIVALFDSTRAGDVVVFADGDWSFESTWLGGHGSCIAKDMRVPCFYSGPGLPKNAQIPSGRTVDLVPTLLDLIGESKRLQGSPRLDGTSLVAQLRSAAEGAAPRLPAAAR
jgi:hypothetical protein